MENRIEYFQKRIYGEAVSDCELGWKTVLVYLAMIDSPQDKDKFQKIYDLYEGLLYHIAWNILHNRQDVEDAVQQTFLKILTHLEKIVQVDCPQTRSYVSIVCRYACLDLVNRRGRAREVPLDDLDELALQDHIREDFLLDAFGKLGFPYREILLLRFRHGYTPREIAKLLDMNPETVKKYIQRGKAKLQEYLDEEVREDAEDSGDR